MQTTSSFVSRSRHNHKSLSLEITIPEFVKNQIPDAMVTLLETTGSSLVYFLLCDRDLPFSALLGHTFPATQI